MHAWNHNDMCVIRTLDRNRQGQRGMWGIKGFLFVEINPQATPTCTMSTIIVNHSHVEQL